MPCQKSYTCLCTLKTYCYYVRKSGASLCSARTKRFCIGILTHGIDIELALNQWGSSISYLPVYMLLSLFLSHNTTLPFYLKLILAKRHPLLDINLPQGSQTNRFHAIHTYPSRSRDHRRFILMRAFRSDRNNKSNKSAS